MTKLHVILYDKDLADVIMGCLPLQGYSSLPVWGNFTIKSILSLIRKSQNKDIKITIIPDSGGLWISKTLQIIELDPPNTLYCVGSTDNIVYADYSLLERKKLSHDEIVKVQVGLVPSDLYFIWKRRLVYILREVNDKRYSLQQFFNKELFENFSRILPIAGKSYLFRNAFEYFTENVRLMDHLADPSFMRFYLTLTPELVTDCIIEKASVVRGSFVGNGCRVSAKIENSVLFYGVNVDKEAVVVNSVILPGNVIERGVRIVNSLVLSGNQRTIGKESSIGGELLDTDYLKPSEMKRRLTIIGEGINIPPYSVIGSGCLLKGIRNPEGPIILEDGISLDIER